MLRPGARRCADARSLSGSVRHPAVGVAQHQVPRGAVAVALEPVVDVQHRERGIACCRLALFADDVEPAAELEVGVSALAGSLERRTELLFARDGDTVLYPPDRTRMQHTSIFSDE